MAKILVAEDEESVSAFISRALESQGHEVILASDGGDALDKLQSDRFDLLLTDIVMPVMDGIALALKASAIAPHMRILLMSGYAAERQRAHNLDALVHDVIAKPFTLEQICNAVADVLSSD